MRLTHISKIGYVPIIKLVEYFFYFDTSIAKVLSKYCVFIYK